MNQRLAKILHLTATRNGPEGHTGAPSVRKTDKPRRRWMLAALMMPALVTALSLLGTGVANAMTVGGDGPTISVPGGLQVTTHWDATVTCDASQHTIGIVATANPAMSSEPVYEEVYLYSYQTGTGRWGPVNYTATLNGLQTYPRGYYAVRVVFGWWTTAGWLTAGPYWINSYTQLGIPTPTWDHEMSSCYV